jgi:hypothetical protein
LEASLDEMDLTAVTAVPTKLRYLAVNENRSSCQNDSCHLISSGKKLTSTKKSHRAKTTVPKRFLRLRHKSIGREFDSEIQGDVRDGSVQQHDWLRAHGFAHSTPHAVMLSDRAVRIAFLRPQDAPRGVGRVSLVYNAQTLESHGGVGSDSRPWTKSGWQAMAFEYFLTAPTT